MADGSFLQYSTQVNIPAESGDMGVLANHVPTIEQLKPGLVEVIEESGSKQFFRTCDPFTIMKTFGKRYGFREIGCGNMQKDSTDQYFAIVSGGFATVQPNSVLSVNAVEGYPLEDFSAEVSNGQAAVRY